jgi:hypothetical protein
MIGLECHSSQQVEYGGIGSQTYGSQELQGEEGHHFFFFK